jgi:hypothetical protein
MVNRKSQSALRNFGSASGGNLIFAPWLLTLGSTTLFVQELDTRPSRNSDLRLREAGPRAERNI